MTIIRLNAMNTRYSARDAFEFTLLYGRRPDLEAIRVEIGKLNEEIRQLELWGRSFNVYMRKMFILFIVNICILSPVAGTYVINNNNIFARDLTDSVDKRYKNSMIRILYFWLTLIDISLACLVTYFCIPSKPLLEVSNDQIKVCNPCLLIADIAPKPWRKKTELIVNNFLAHIFRPLVALPFLAVANFFSIFSIEFLKTSAQSEHECNAAIYLHIAATLYFAVSRLCCIFKFIREITSDSLETYGKSKWRLWKLTC